MKVHTSKSIIQNHMELVPIREQKLAK